MKFNVRKMTSVTLLASMMLTTVSPPMMPVLAQETETEMTSSAEVETEGFETEVMEMEECIEETAMLAAMCAEPLESEMEIASVMKLDLQEEEAVTEAESETDAATVKNDEKPSVEAITEAEDQTEAETKPAKDKKERETSTPEVNSEKETEAVTEGGLIWILMNLVWKNSGKILNSM